MFCNLTPVYGRDYFLGDVVSTRRPGAFVSEAIAQDKYRARVEAGELIASHVGIVVGENLMVEAVTPAVQTNPMEDYILDPELLLWVVRPKGQTLASAKAMADFGLAHKGEPYDLSAIVGLHFSDEDDEGTEPNPLADAGEWVCSRLVDMGLRDTEPLRAVLLPMTFKNVHPTWRTPQGLLDAPIWEPASGLPPA